MDFSFAQAHPGISQELSPTPCQDQLRFNSAEYTIPSRHSLEPTTTSISPGTPHPSQSQSSHFSSTSRLQSPRAPPVATPSSSTLVHRTSKSHVRRSKLDKKFLETAFTADSHYHDTYLRGCLDRILAASFHLDGEHEPRLNSPDGATILGTLSPACLFPNLKDSFSIYRILVHDKDFGCLMCGKKHTSVTRAVGCIRKHLDHRPFVCRGPDAGCQTCLVGKE